MEHRVFHEPARTTSLIKNKVDIGGIPAILWGSPSDCLFIAVHGDQSNKEDEAVRILAEEAMKKGCQTLSFDLPGHGDRKQGEAAPRFRDCVDDLTTVMEYARALADDINLFACSIGAYFSLVAYKADDIGQTLFLSPVVDMRRLIENMMGWFGISEARLREEGAIATPAKTLYWDDYQYALDNPVRWNKETYLLYGENDEVSDYVSILSFVETSGADLTVLEGGEHYFHTDMQLAASRKWLDEKICRHTISLRAPSRGLPGMIRG